MSYFAPPRAAAALVLLILLISNLPAQVAADDAGPAPASGPGASADPGPSSAGVPGPGPSPAGFPDPGPSPAGGLAPEGPHAGTPVSRAPQAPVRMPAEWEPMSGVLVSYPFGISYALIAEMSEDVEVVTVVADASQQAYVESRYSANGVHLDNCTFLHAPTNTYWTRDYGPWYVFDGNGDLAIVNHSYNRPRPLDDAIPERLGENRSIQVHHMSLEHTGGNWMSDGLGIAMSTDLVVDENPGLTTTQIDQTVLQNLGVHTYHKVSDPQGEYIRHIDCWAKLLAPDTLLIARVPIDDDRYQDYEAAVQYFENQTSSWGTPYRIFRIYEPSGQPYTNSLILNGKVLVPVTGSGWDDDALAVYEAAMPGYEVLGFAGSWASTDALHCRTHEIVDRDMLEIRHIPLRDGEPPEGGNVVEATITPHSGGALSGAPEVYYSTGSGWLSANMQSSTGDNYTATLPSFKDGTPVEYYIHARDDRGNAGNHPVIGAPGAHNFTVIMTPPEPEGPSATPGTLACGGTVNVTVRVTDNVAVEMVYLEVEHPDGTTVNLTMDGPAPETDTYWLEGTYEAVGLHNLTVRARDVNGNWNSSSGSFTTWDGRDPVADAGPDREVDQGDEVVFDGSGSWDNVGIADHIWTFHEADDVELHGVSPAHTFTVAGAFEVTLTVVDALGNRDDDTLKVTVRDVTAPTADAGDDVETDQAVPVTFDGTGSTDDAGPGIVNYTWELIDGGALELYGPVPSHTFPDAGVYAVTLTVEDAAGNAATDTMNVTVLDVTPPVANAGEDMEVDQNGEFTLDGSGSGDNVGIVEYAWTLPPGAGVGGVRGAFTGGWATVSGRGAVSGEKATVSLPEAGVFTITLTVTDARGNADTDTVNVTSLDTEPPVASGKAEVFDDGQGYGNVTVALDGSSSTDNVGVVNWTWTIDDDGCAPVVYGMRASWCATGPGNYPFTLTVSDARGNTHDAEGFFDVPEGLFPDESDGSAEDGADGEDGTDGDGAEDGDEGTDGGEPVDGDGGVDGDDGVAGGGDDGGEGAGEDDARAAGTMAVVAAVACALLLAILLLRRRGGKGEGDGKGDDGGDGRGEGGDDGGGEGGAGGAGGGSHGGMSEGGVNDMGGATSGGEGLCGPGGGCVGTGKGKGEGHEAPRTPLHAPSSRKRP